MCYIYKMKGFSAKKLMKSVNVENVLIAALAIVLVVLVVMYINKNNEGFQEKPSLFFYNVAWCGYCKKAKENVFDNGANWAKVTNKDKINLISVDCDSEEGKDKCKGIEGYPTIKCNGKTFNDSVTPDNISNFIKQCLKN
jgi:glutaredoxin